GGDSSLSPAGPQARRRLRAHARRARQAALEEPAIGGATMTGRNRYGFQVRSGMRRGLRSAVPLPTRLVANEEFPPIPPTPPQRRIEDRILAEAGRQAPRLGLSPREFLSRSGGMAGAPPALHPVLRRSL